jgi:hypothetical protein
MNMNKAGRRFEVVGRRTRRVDDMFILPVPLSAALDEYQDDVDK